VKKYYLCGIAFQHELGETDDLSIFETLEDLKAKHKCWEECGIVELRVRKGKTPEEWYAHRWIEEQNLNLILELTKI
jgi:hypothetical protein